MPMYAAVWPHWSVRWASCWKAPRAARRWMAFTRASIACTACTRVNWRAPCRFRWASMPTTATDPLPFAVTEFPVNRRSFLALGGTLLAGAALAGWTLGRGGAQPLLLSARDDSQGGHWVVGYQLDGRQAFACPVAERCHDVVPHPSLPLALFVGRRPSRESYLVDTREGRVLQVLHTPDDRHFQGHAVLHRQGELLYTTENDTREPGRGVIGVY